MTVQNKISKPTANNQSDSFMWFLNHVDVYDNTSSHFFCATDNKI